MRYLLHVCFRTVIKPTFYSSSIPTYGNLCRKQMAQRTISSFFKPLNVKPKDAHDTVIDNKNNSKKRERQSTSKSPPTSTKKKTKPDTAVANEQKIEASTSAELKSEPNASNSNDDEERIKFDTSSYNPDVAKYHPIKDAVWNKDDNTPYMALARTLEAIENVSSRLKMIEILSNYFRSIIVLSPNDLLPSIYLCLNKVAPAYEGIELGIAETTLIKAISQSTGRPIAHIKAETQKLGDLGIVAEQSKNNQKMICQPAELTVKFVYNKLKEIAKFTGQQSQMKKVEKIQSMIVACKKSEVRFLIRSLLGKMRIGLAEQSVLQALALACCLTPPEQKAGFPPKILNASKKISQNEFKERLDELALILKTTYCACPNYDLILPHLLRDGIEKLPEHCKLTPGIPLKPMLANPTKGIQEVLQRFDGISFTCEYKYDGERAQIHIDRNDVHIFSRNQENNTSKYPDLISRIGKCKEASVVSCVLDCEAVAWDRVNKTILPFQILSTRKRKDANEALIKVNVCVFMFDLLYLNGESLVGRPFSERRQLLKEHFREVEGEWHFAKYLDTTTMEEVQDFLEESIKGNCEGLMVKTLQQDATYEIAKRSRNWLKIKKDYLNNVGDTIDLIVIGGYLGKGKRTGTYGGFLLACYDEANEEYQSICKIGTGFSDESLQQHSNFFKDHIINEPKPYYRFDVGLEPDHWFDPVQVWEIKCADLSLSPIHRAAIGIVDPEKGISLRFPRFIRIRDDKNSEDGTTASEIADMYSNQELIKNQQTKKTVDEEVFY